MKRSVSPGQNLTKFSRFRQRQLDLYAADELRVDLADELEVELGHIGVRCNGIADSVAESEGACFVLRGVVPPNVEFVLTRFQLVGARLFIHCPREWAVSLEERKLTHRSDSIERQSKVSPRIPTVKRVGTYLIDPEASTPVHPSVDDNPIQ